MSVASSFERQMLDLINEERTSRGIDPLTLELRLNDASEDHSIWMDDARIFSHAGQGGSDPGDRMRDAGFEFAGNWTWGENIAFQSERGDPGIADDVEDLHASLMNSPGHRANILNPEFEVIGIGIEEGDNRGFDAVYVTQNFARTGAEVDLDVTPTPVVETPPVPDTEDEDTAEPDIVATPETDPTTDPDPTAEPDTDPTTGDDPDTSSDPEPDVVAEPESDPTLEPEPEPEPESDPDPVTVSDPELDTEAEPEPDTDPETDPDSDPAEPENLRVMGDATDDTLTGGAGNDILTGEDGADTFVFTEGFDIITDFDPSDDQDRLDLSANTDITDMADLLSGGHLLSFGPHSIVKADDGDLTLLVDVHACTLQESDFIFA